MKQRNGQLTPQQRRFIEEYLKDFNAIAAYRRAGYKFTNDESGWACSSRLLGSAKGQAYLAELLKKQQNRLELSSDRILEEFVRVALCDITDVVEFDKDGVKLKDSKTLPKSVTAAIKSVSISSMTIPVKGSEPIEKVITTVTMHDKMRALERLADRFGVFKEQLDTAAPDGIELELVIANEDSQDEGSEASA